MNWYLFGGLMFGFVGIVLLFSLLRTAGREDRAERHAMKELFPDADITITQLGDPNERNVPKSNAKVARPSRAVGS